MLRVETEKKKVFNLCFLKVAFNKCINKRLLINCSCQIEKFSSSFHNESYF